LWIVDPPVTERQNFFAIVARSIRSQISCAAQGLKRGDHLLLLLGNVFRSGNHAGGDEARRWS